MRLFSSEERSPAGSVLPERTEEQLPVIQRMQVAGSSKYFPIFYAIGPVPRGFDEAGGKIFCAGAMETAITVKRRHNAL